MTLDHQTIQPGTIIRGAWSTRVQRYYPTAEAARSAAARFSDSCMVPCETFDNILPAVDKEPTP